ncbi:MAG: hypothetical protein IJS65_07130 [Clostridia bacterium]|nr:hypothetical protein [Clostridia bacterium]
MKKAFKITAALLAALLLALLFAACGEKAEEPSEDDEEQVRAVIAECETACRALDLEGVLKTLDPKIQKAVKSTGLFSAISFENFAGLLGLDEDIDGEELNGALSVIEIEITEVKLSGAKATAKVTAKADLGEGGITVKTDVKCKKTDGKWYITGILLDKKEG